MQAVLTNDNSITIRSEYAEVLLEAGKVIEAVALLKELEKDSGDASSANLLLAQLALQTGDFQSAFDYYSRLINSGEHASEAMFGMAQISERAGATDNARQLYARIQDGDYAVPSQIRLAQLIAQHDGIDAAMASLKQYGDGNPDKSLDMLRARAELLIANGNTKGAMELYDQSVVNFPDEASLKLARAFLLVKLDKIAPAIQAMRELLATRNDDPIVLNALGYTMIDRTSDVHQGQGYIQRALQFSPDSGAVLDSMGWAEFKLGHANVALDYMQRAIKRTVDADLDLHLGDVLWSLKRYEDAVAAWQTGLTHAPKHAQLLQRIKMAEKQHKIAVKPDAKSPVN